MLRKVGLLPLGNLQQIPFAYKMYKQKDEFIKEAEEFKSTFSTDVRIDFVGVWYVSAFSSNAKTQRKKIGLQGYCFVSWRRSREITASHFI
jgi:hypothetical protein